MDEQQQDGWMSDSRGWMNKDDLYKSIAQGQYAYPKAKP